MNRMLKRITLLTSYIVIACFLAQCTNRNQDSSNLQSGDLIFQSSQSGQSKAIQLATHSPYSHMGIIYIEGTEVYVFEAVQPVKLTPLEEWIRRGDDQHYAVKRLKKAELLTPDVLTRMQQIGEKHIGKNYDLYFEWSDERIYCSELVWKIYNEALGIEIGERQHLKDFDLSHPIVKKQLTERYGSSIPMDEWVISPAAMFNSPLLKEVYRN